MFTGIIQSVGKITAIERQTGDCRLTINTGKLPMQDVQPGDSIAVNGICLTAVELGSNYFRADVSNETLSRTLLHTAIAGMPVNLELALTPSTRLGGHIVSGHVDGIASLIEKKPDGRSFRLKFKAPDHLAKYIAEKGSVCLDGVSLTVNEVKEAVFSVNIVPHTLKETTLSDVEPGSKVNIEVDLLARYLERLMQGDDSVQNHQGITEAFLQKSGFLD